MIQNKKDLIEYLEADRLSLGRDTKRPSLQDTDADVDAIITFK